MEIKELFASNGTRSELSDSEWLGGWVAIVGGVHGRPTAQQFNAVANVLQSMILKVSNSAAEAIKKAEDAVPTKDFTRDSIIKKIADGIRIDNLNAGLLDGHKADYFAKKNYISLCEASFPLDKWVKGNDGTYTQKSKLSNITGDDSVKKTSVIMSIPMFKKSGNRAEDDDKREMLGIIDTGYADIEDDYVTCTIYEQPITSIDVQWVVKL